MIRHLETLARIPLFRSLDSKAIRALDGQCGWKRYRAGEWIIDCGDKSVDLFVVSQGHVRVQIRMISGKEALLRDIHDGEYFGELAALDGQPRSAGIVAVTDTVIARMSPSVFRAAVHAHPDVCDQLLALLASQVRMLANRVNEFTSLDVRHRLYAELLRIARPARDSGGEMVISPPPTHAELAARVSTHREAVTRELGKLAKAGLLMKRRGALALSDPGKLRAMIEEAMS
ncbi:Crp/Fnr family transcriptional regulator [Terrarubrum flagellatum]|uniref:Crp/Fnr family transcriptional regulator n=1 Tax=Terrirubrum flagellatum TaxID=2895980 RepID=UPI00314502E3